MEDRKKYIKNNIDEYQISKKINYLIENDVSFFVNRTRSEDLIVYKIKHNMKLTEEDYEVMHINCGVYPKYDENIIKYYCKEYMEVYENTDIFCYHYAHRLDVFLDLLCDKVTAGSFANCSYPNKFGDNSYLNKLNNKTVIVISSITDTLKLSYETMNLNFKFGLIKYYKCTQSIAGNEIDNNWEESLEIMKNDLEKIDFDIALISAGGYSGPLGLFIKKLGKQAINMGGSLQHHFKVNGNRWGKNPEWINTLEHEIPKNSEKVEGGCYW
jgi:hypothetical protein